MEKDDVLEILSERLGKGLFMLISLKQHGPLLKEQLWEHTNTYYEEKFPDQPQPLIQSRHMLDILTARLEGAGLVDVKEVGRARVFSRSPLSEELTRYIKIKNHN